MTEGRNLQFAASDRIDAIKPLLDEFFQHVVPEYEPLFISDEATIYDVSMDDVEDLRARCSAHYGVSVSLDELQQPLSRLVPALAARRASSA